MALTGWILGYRLSLMAFYRVEQSWSHKPFTVTVWWMLAVCCCRGLLKGLPFILWWREFYFICSQDARTRCPKHKAAQFQLFRDDIETFLWYSYFDENPFNLCVHAARPIQRTAMTTMAIIQRLILWERSVFSLMSQHTCLFDKIITRYFCRSSRRETSFPI